jgi:predicted TIM-barrel fold metal-dependent hydrolase
MASLGEELLISADSHVIEDPHFWENRLPASFKDQAPVFPERQVGGAFQAHPGGWDPHERVKEMAVDGVSGEVLYPSFALDLFGLQDAALQEACFRVYNDWILEYCAVAPDRLFGVACIATYDIPHGVAELERCRTAGMPGAMVWQAPPPELSFATDHYERLWGAAQDLEVPISLHILTGQPFPWPRPAGRGDRRQAFETMRSAVNSKLLYASNAMSDLIMTGVLERYPRLKFVLVENEVSWIPFYLGQYDKYWGRGNLDSPLTMFPSEYFFRQFYATFFNDSPARWIFGNWASNNLMWSNDYPHPNSTWPKSREVIARDLGHVSEGTRARLLRENVRELYQLPALTSMPV